MGRQIMIENLRYGRELIMRGFASLQNGGVIMDVTNAEQAIVAEDAGAIAVMALHAVPADIRKTGGVARMADPLVITEIIDAVTIPVMAKCRIGHFVEAAILEALGVDMVDESEVLTPVDTHHVDKRRATVPFVCGARDLGEALRRIEEGAAMIRTKGEAGTGDVKEAVRHMKLIMGEIRSLKGKNEEELRDVAKELKVSVSIFPGLVQETAELQRLPVVNFAAGGIATPADAALMMQLGADGVFVGSGIFKSENSARMASAIVDAVKNYDDAKKLAEISKGLGMAMKGIDVGTLAEGEMLQRRGW